MPVILPNAHAIFTWLGMTSLSRSSDAVSRLLKPYDAGPLDVYTVPREVGRVGTDDPKYILPVASRKDGIAAAFGRMRKRTPSVDDANSETNAPQTEELKSLNGAGKRSHSQCESIKDDNLGVKHEGVKSEDLNAKRRKEQPVKDESSQDQIDSDAALAKKLQEEEEQGHQSTSLESIANSKPKDVASGRHESQSSLHPSSKFSPDPFNPPVSPPRPYGGYSTLDKHGTAQRVPQATKMGGGRMRNEEGNSRRHNEYLKQAAKGTKDIRNFFGQK